MRKLLLIFLIVCSFLNSGCSDKGKKGDARYTPSLKDIPNSNLNTDAAFIPDKNQSNSANQRQQPAQAPSMLSIINACGVSWEINKDNLLIHVDSNDYAEGAPLLQKMGILNPRLNSFQISNASPFLSALFGLDSATILIPKYFSETNLKNLSISVYVNSPDEYGNMASHLAFSFNILKSKSDQINWENFNYSNFSRITQNYFVTPWVSNQAYQSGAYLR